MKKLFLTLCYTFPLLVGAYTPQAMAQSKGHHGPSPHPHVEGKTDFVGKQATLFTMVGLAVASYGISEYAFDTEDRLYRNVQAGFMTTGDGTSILVESAGFEKRLAPWFAMSIEWNNQQWIMPDEDGAQEVGFGMGMMAYYRWYLTGNQSFSPFVEYGTGLFQGFEEFPDESSLTSFILTTKAGVEYTMPSGHKLRASYGQLYHSNKGLSDRPVNLDANGFTISYSAYLGTSKW